MGEKFDFSGWATKNDLLCSDGRTIRKGAFKDQDGEIVPLVWQHKHDSPDNVLGHALLRNREEGTYAFCSFNDTENGKKAKQLVNHGDVKHLSIFANKLRQEGGDVLHGVIREVSLVLSGANPGAKIENIVLEHFGFEEESETEAIITTGEDLYISHEDKEEPEKAVNEAKEEPKKEEKKEMAEDNERTVKDVIDSMTEEQKKVMYFIVGKALEDAKAGEHDDNDDRGDDMSHNVFEGDAMTGDAMQHAEALQTILSDAKRFGSLKESYLQHADEYGITNIEYLFPDAKAMTNAPDFIKRNDEWVDKFMKNTHKTPFSRIKSIFADITEDDARAKGYIRGKMKKEEFFALVKRVTTPTTVYKKQKLDRDDIVDITDFDVVSWLKTEMRIMLDEEIARAGLVGDGRDESSDDKISALNIRPIWTDNDLFSIKQVINTTASTTADQRAKAYIRGAIKARKGYKGSGSPILFAPEDIITDCLLMEDSTGRVIYDSIDKLATALRVKEIVPCEVMEGLSRTVDGIDRTLLGIIVNPKDYNYGADKGGSVNMFDDFDIDYNQQKYLMETRCSGALVKPYSAIVLEEVVGA